MAHGGMQGTPGSDSDNVSSSQNGAFPDLSDDHSDAGMSRLTQPLTINDPCTSSQPWTQLPETSSALRWMIGPLEESGLDDALAEGTPVYIRRSHCPGYYAGLYTIRDFLRTGQCQYTYNVDVVKYIGNVRQTYNSEAQGSHPAPCPGTPAQLESVMRRYNKEGCSVRILHPQQHCDVLWSLMSKLESELRCCVGCNAYLTPPGSQGFAPHYDDIDAFILQLEGEKVWKVYVDENNLLPLHNRLDYSRAELPPRPCLEVSLKPGDLLILPRGTIHEGHTPQHTHSLHITLSANQGCSWAGLVQAALPVALESASMHLAMRQSMGPSNFDVLGLQSVVTMEQLGSKEELGEDGPKHAATTRMGETCRKLTGIFADSLYDALNAAADEQWEGFMSERLPNYPPLPKPEDMDAPPRVTRDSTVALIVPGAARVVGSPGQDEVRVVYGLYNNRTAHAKGRSTAPDSEEEEEEPGGGRVLVFPGKWMALLAEIMEHRGKRPLRVRQLLRDHQLTASSAEGSGSHSSTLGVLQQLADGGLLAVGQAPGRPKRLDSANTKPATSATPRPAHKTMQAEKRKRKHGHAS